jgi:hypothetical protein
VSITPTEINGITPYERQIANLDFVCHAFGFQNSFASPFIYTLRARASPSKIGGPVIAFLIIRPNNLNGKVIGLSNLARLDRRSMRF